MNFHQLRANLKEAKGSMASDDKEERDFDPKKHLQHGYHLYSEHPKTKKQTHVGTYDSAESAKKAFWKMDDEGKFPHDPVLKHGATGKVYDYDNSVPDRWNERKKANEEVEQIDESNMRYDYEAAVRPKSSDVKNWQNRNKNPRAAAAAKKYIRRMTKLGGLGRGQTKKDTEEHMKAHFGEQAQLSDAQKLSIMKDPNKAKVLTALRRFNATKDINKLTAAHRTLVASYLSKTGGLNALNRGTETTTLRKMSK